MILSQIMYVCITLIRYGIPSPITNHVFLLCSYGGTNCTKIVGWVSDSKNPSINAYAIVEVLLSFSLWEGMRFPYMSFNGLKEENLHKWM